MGVLADYVAKSQPAYAGGGCTGEATEGSDWEFPFDEVRDDNGDLINLTGVTGTCEVLTAVGGSTIATLTFTGTAIGTYTLTLPAASTAGLAAGTKIRRCHWHFTLDDGADTITVWNAVNSRFYIFPEA